MNVVFLSPHFPPNWYRFVAGLRDAGANVLGIADVDYEHLHPELRASLNDYYRVDSLGDYNQLVRALGWFINRHGLIDRLDSLNEHWLEVEAALRTDFNIPGIDRRGIAAIKRKSLMKKRFLAAGLQPGPWPSLPQPFGAARVRPRGRLPGRRQAEHRRWGRADLQARGRRRPGAVPAREAAGRLHRRGVRGRRDHDL
jgi:hypothetical protein